MHDSKRPQMQFHKTLWGILCISYLWVAFADAQTAYDVLERYNLPKGILPQGVQSYLLTKEGSFEFFLADKCEFNVQGNYMLKYKTTITGTVESGVLRDLKGLSVRFLFVWIGISRVEVSGDELSFFVGPFSVSFPLSYFDKCPRCGCGFDCSNTLLQDL
ncbi:hypothetical protein J5N97_012698 [Dioscorea zingiberensis]|uniref:Uncharacterized protein n=1 Tax=Dioscorea zingiberensis TaxID=325984 RepID=A0A9D5HI18_9LILI|nr:hypothetical protein J5N97_012698 [Dioscorea zingiberensis]